MEQHTEESEPRSLQALKAHLAASSESKRPENRPYIYHAHTHFPAGNSEALETASAFKERLKKRFSSEKRFWYGTTHSKPIGPHFDGQFELVFTRHDFLDVLSWLALFRPPELSILIHAHTLDVVEDHTSRAMWLGPANKLKVEPLLPFERKMKQQVADGADEAEVLWEHHI